MITRQKFIHCATASTAIAIGAPFTLQACSSQNGEGSYEAKLRDTWRPAKAPTGDKALLHTLPKAGLDTPTIVALAQLIAFVSFQTRVVQGLIAMRDAGLNQIAQPTSSVETPNKAPTDYPLSSPIRIKGFTNEELNWKSWLDVPFRHRQNCCTAGATAQPAAAS